MVEAPHFSFSPTKPSAHHSHSTSSCTIPTHSNNSAHPDATPSSHDRSGYTDRPTYTVTSTSVSTSVDLLCYYLPI